METYRKISAAIWELFKKYSVRRPKGEEESKQFWADFEAVLDENPEYYWYTRDYIGAVTSELERIWEAQEK